MANNDRSELIERVINNEFQRSCSLGIFANLGGIAGTLNDVMDNEYPRGAGVGIQFADGDQYIISIKRIK
jgi:hypothetical protein